MPGGYPFRQDAYLRAVERIIAAGDNLTVGGEIIEDIDPHEQSWHPRRPPTRMILIAQSIRGVSGHP